MLRRSPSMQPFDNIPANRYECDIPRQGAARQLGKDFRTNLEAFPGVVDEGRDEENLRCYRKA